MTMRFDWYQATLRDDRVGGGRGGVLVADLARGLGGEPEDGPGRYGYATETAIRAGSEVKARVLHGGTQPWPSVRASGDETDRFVPWLREVYPLHRVTRMDAAQDFDGEGAWDKLMPIALGVADERGLKVHQAGDWHRGEDGRTLYVGSRKSPVFARLYEKGKQLATTKVDAPVSPDWVRLELEVRPQREAREVAATMDPEACWGFSAWSGALLERVIGSEVERVSMQAWRAPDDERAWAFMLRQYGHLLRRRSASLGTWEALGRAIGRELDHEQGSRAPRASRGL